MPRVSYIFLPIFLATLISTSCTYFNRERSASDYTDKLNAQVKAGEFEQIYSQLSSNAKSLTSKDEFLRDMNKVVTIMKASDESLMWQKGSLVLSNEYADLYFVHREIGPENKKLNITVTVTYSTGFIEFFDLCVTPAESSTEAVCVTNTLRKI